jgi:CheY-like chemotaxis protein
VAREASGAFHTITPCAQPVAPITMARISSSSIAVTANAMAGDERLCIEAGMDDYLTKPLKKAQLEAVVRRWLERRAA